LSIVATVSIGVLVLGWRSPESLPLTLALLGGGLAVAIVGYVDDRRSLPVAVRMLVHLGSAAWAVYALGGLPALRWGTSTLHLGLSGDVLAVFGIVWMLNLFNFMDGIDGLAASEAVFVALAGTALAGFLPSFGAAIALLVAAANLGFLCWNWPPAKIFMGDVGSGYLGYVLAVLALSAARENSVMLYVWLILGGVFLVDATVTLARRAARGERVYEAHRSHAYQWLSRHWKSHKSVTIAVAAVNLFWLLPCAWFATRHPLLAVWAVRWFRSSSRH
jgi:Fuc2NAc and GlcNAc transferase